jgi:hypothetical protein
MERSDEHSPRVDDESTRPDVPVPAGALSPDEANERAEVARVLATVTFPATREFLFKAAMENNAAERVIDRLRRLPTSESFETVQDVWAATGGSTEASNHT